MLQISNLCVSFGSQKVLKELSFQLKAGLTLLSGSNGSGKSTLLRVLAGLITPEKGTVVGSYGAGHASLFEPSLGLYDDLTLRENLIFFAAISFVQGARLEWGIKKFGLDEFVDRQVKQLSTGQRVRGALCRTCLIDADLYLFDEPFSGLDARGVAAFQQILGSLGDLGKMVLVVAHEARVLDSLPVRKMTMREGRVE